MDLESEFLINPLSYILGAVSFLGFLIVVLGEGKRWLQGLLMKQGSRAYPAQAGPWPGERSAVIAGLIFLGGLFSVLIFLCNEKVERLNANISLMEYMLILFAFIVLPGLLTGISAGIWIKATRPTGSCDLFGSLLIGMLAYIALIAVVGFTDLDPLLFLCGPAVTLLVYRYSEKAAA